MLGTMVISCGRKYDAVASAMAIGILTLDESEINQQYVNIHSGARG